jgi:chemotaxis protein MotB
MSDQKGKIIIKKVKRISGGGAHGGSWKVAYADFVTAMMAFFLLLWLLSMVSTEKRARMATYFKSFSIFQQSGTSFMEKSSEMFNQAGESDDKLSPDMSGKGQHQTAESFKESIKEAIAAKLGDIKDQVVVDVFEGGVRIQLVDKAGKPMFDVGSSAPTPMATRIMQVIGDQVKDMPNPISVEGHTDALAYKMAATRGNWELSTERALTAKKQLEGFGLNPARLTRVAGYADTVPFITEDPEDPRNRRISVILLFPEKETPPFASPSPAAPAAKPVLAPAALAN